VGSQNLSWHLVKSALELPMSGPGSAHGTAAFPNKLGGGGAATPGSTCSYTPTHMGKAPPMVLVSKPHSPTTGAGPRVAHPRSPLPGFNRGNRQGG
jgi:hypothetical protein